MQHFLPVLILLSPRGLPGSGASNGRLKALLQEEPGLPASPGGFPGKGGGPGLRGSDLLLSLATLLSGSVSVRWRPWGRKQLQAAVCVPTTLGEEGWPEALSSPSSRWVPSPVPRRGSGEPSPSSPEPKKSNSLMASSESSSSSSSSISGTRALEGSWGIKKTRQVRGLLPEPSPPTLR